MGYLASVEPWNVFFLVGSGAIMPLMFEARDYPAGFKRELPLDVPSIPGGPQEIFFVIALVAISDGVDVGGTIIASEENPDPLDVFAMANVTILDDSEVLLYYKLVCTWVLVLNKVYNWKWKTVYPFHIHQWFQGYFSGCKSQTVV